MRAVLLNPETFQAEGTWRDLGRPSITIEEFAQAAEPRATDCLTPPACRALGSRA